MSIQYGDTALHVAAYYGKTEVVRLLTEAQALLNIQRTVSAISYHLSIQTCIMSSVTSPPHSQVKANPTSFHTRQGHTQDFSKGVPKGRACM